MRKSANEVFLLNGPSLAACSLDQDYFFHPKIDVIQAFPTPRFIGLLARLVDLVQRKGDPRLCLCELEQIEISERQMRSENAKWRCGLQGSRRTGPAISSLTSKKGPKGKVVGKLRSSRSPFSVAQIDPNSSLT